MPPSNAVASIQLVANHSMLATGLRAAAGIVQSFAATTRSALTSMALAPGKALAGLGKSMLTLGSFSVASRGLDMMVDAGKGVFDFERKLTRFGIATRTGAAGLDDVRKAARATSAATGIDASVVLDSARAYVDLAGAQNNSIEKMNILARAGQASEAEGKDLAGMMYQLTRSMKVADNQMEDTMGGLINQAKDGAIEAKQMAAEFSGMMPIFARFGVTGREGAIQLGAMYQVTRDGFDSAAQAATGMIRLMAGFQRHASRFKSWGVEVFKPGSKNELRSMADIMKQVHDNPLSKDIEALIKAFGRSEAWRTFELLNEAPDRLKALEEAGRTNGVIMQDLATFTESASGRMDVAFEKMKNGFAEALTPERIEQIVQGIGSIANSIGPLMAAVSGVASAFGKFVHTVARAKGWIQGDSKYKPTDREQGLLTGLENEESGRKTYWTPQERAEAKRIRQKKADYDKAMGSIMDLEDDFGPTDASVKQAIRLGHSWAGQGPKMAGDSASIAYLKGRDKEISTTRYKRLEGEVNAEEEKAMTPYARTQKGYARAEAEDRAKDAAQAAYLNEHVKPIIDAAIHKLGDAIGRAVSGRPPPPVHVDGNPIAKANGNATNRRRH